MTRFQEHHWIINWYYNWCSKWSLTLVLDLCVFRCPAFILLSFGSSTVSFLWKTTLPKLYSVPVEPSLKVSSPLLDKVEYITQARSAELFSCRNMGIEQSDSKLVELLYPGGGTLKKCFILPFHLDHSFLHGPWPLQGWSSSFPLTWGTTLKHPN